MKKTLVAIAALAATGAYAQSTVTIDGIMDANYMNAKAYGQGYSLVHQSGARKTNNGIVTVTATAADTNLAGLKNTFFGYGLEHDLSKRTFVYLRGSNQNVNDLSFTSVVVNGATLTAMPTDKKISITAVGVSHSF